MARMSLEEAATRGRVDAAKVDALTEDDIARFNVAEGFDPNDTLKGLRRVHTPADIRARASLTQAEMASRLTIPLKTWRNWEQGRVTLEPTVRALLALVADDPERAFRVLGTATTAEADAARLIKTASALAAIEAALDLVASDNEAALETRLSKPRPKATSLLRKGSDSA